MGGDDIDVGYDVVGLFDGEIDGLDVGRNVIKVGGNVSTVGDFVGSTVFTKIPIHDTKLSTVPKLIVLVLWGLATNVSVRPPQSHAS